MKLTARNPVALPEDVYAAKLEAAEETSTQYGQAVKLSFLIVDGDYAGERVMGLASIPANGLTPKSKLRLWAEGMLGRRLNPGEEVDLDGYIGKKCRLSLKVEATERGSFNRIADVLPIGRAAKPVEPLPDLEQNIPF